jgi:hypothetical protein
MATAEELRGSDGRQYHPACCGYYAVIACMSPITTASVTMISVVRKGICTLLAMAASFAMAQTAERPPVSAGDRWSFVVYYTVPSKIPNRTWVISSIGPDQIVGTENDEPLTLTRDLNVLDSPRLRESKKSSRGTLDVDVIVVSYEPIEVPAGRFQAFRLHATGTLGGSSPSNTFYAGQTTTTYWYSPAARAIVKSVHHNPYQGTTTVELVDLRLQR